MKPVHPILLTLLAIVALATTPACAGKLHGRAGGVATGPGAVSAALNIGADTRLGYGAPIVPEAALSAITGVNSDNFKLDAVSGLAPANGGAGTYGAAWTRTGGATTYTLTGLSGRRYVLTVVANAAHVAAQATDTGSGQLGAYVGLSTAAGGPVLGGTIYLRETGVDYNPTNAVAGWSLSPPVNASLTGPGTRVTITSDAPDTALDANGNPRLQHGGRLGRVYWDPYGVFETQPYDFSKVWFYTNKTVIDPAQEQLFSGAGGLGGENFYDCRAEAGLAVTNPAFLGGLSTRGPTTISGCHFVNLGTGILHSGDNLTVINPIFEANHGDAIQTGGNHVLVDGYFGFAWSGVTADHPDSFQWETGGDGTGVFDDVHITHSISVDDEGGGLTSCWRMGGTVAPGKTTNVIMENSICYNGANNGASVPRGDHPIVQFLTNLTDPLLKADGSKVRNVITVSDAINGAVVDHIASNEISTVGSTGTITGGGNIDWLTNSAYDSASRTTAQLCATYALALPNLVCSTHADAKWRSRAGVLFMFTPSNTPVASGGFKQLDGTFSGALFAACAPATIGAWNDGSVWACNDNTWLAAHQPAA